MASVRVYEPATTPFLPNMGKSGHQEGQGWSADPPLACLVPSVWSQIWKRKHQDAVLTFLTIDILYFSNSKLNGKVLGIKLKQCLLWAQLSNFNLVKVGYYPLLPLAAIAFKVVHCLFLYLLYRWVLLKPDFWEHENLSGLSVIWLINIKLYKEKRNFGKNPRLSRIWLNCCMA